MMKRWRNQTVKNGGKIRKKSGMRGGVRYIEMDKNRSGLINGLLRMELKGVRIGDRIILMIIRLRSIGLRSGIRLMEFMRRGMRFIDY